MHIPSPVRFRDATVSNRIFRWPWWAAFKPCYLCSLAVLVILTQAITNSVSAESLLDIYRLALRADSEFLSAGAANRAAQEGRPQALALLRPDIRADASGEGVYQDLRRSPNLGADTGTFGRYQFGLSLTQPVYRQELWIQLDQAGISQRQADVEYASARQDLMLRVASRYFGVLQSLDELSFALTTLEAFSQQLEQSQQRFEVGLIAITDVEEAKAGSDRAKADVIQAETAVDNSREALREVTGAYHNSLSPLNPGKVPLVAPKPANIDAWTQTALEQNLAVLSGRLASNVAQKEIQRARSRHLPTIDLVGSHVYSDRGSVNSSGTYDVNSAVSLQLQIPIYQGGLIMSQTRESRHTYQQSLDEYERRRRSAQRSTRDAFLGVQAGISRIQALTQAVQSAKSAKDAIEAGFEVGTRTSVDVLDADRDLFRARRDLAVARYGYILDILSLKQAAGTLSENDMAEVDGWLSKRRKVSTLRTNTKG